MKIISALCLLAAFIVGTASVTADNQVSLDRPPASLEKWYKPANKRQEWLHTMFRLRREMQAISEYAALNDQAGLEKWIKRLQKDYNKISEMVPEWEQEIKPRLLPELEMFANKGDYLRLGKTLQMVQRTCDDCHRQYQPLVTAIYRSPHYDNIRLKDIDGLEQGFDDNMEDLSDSVNRILIALDDGHYPVALQASQTLAAQLKGLGASCSGCHQDEPYPQERILGKETRQRLESLQVAIREQRVEDSQKLMGEIGVTICARCHNTHRIVNDLRNALLPED